MELVRIIMDDDSTGALKFLKKHVGKKAWAVLEGKGHCLKKYSMLLPTRISSILCSAER